MAIQDESCRSLSIQVREMKLEATDSRLGLGVRVSEVLDALLEGVEDVR